MRRLLFVATVVTLVTGVAAIAWAQPKGHGGAMCPMDGMERTHHGGFGRMRPMGQMHGPLARAEELDLEKQQVEQIRNLGTDWAVQRVDLTAALQKARIQLTEALRADEVDMEQVEKRLDAVFQAQKELKLGQIRHMGEVRQVLTEEQREKLGEGVMGRGMMGAHHGQKMHAPGARHRGPGMHGRRGCSMMAQGPRGRDEGHHDKQRGRGMRR